MASPQITAEHYSSPSTRLDTLGGRYALQLLGVAAIYVAAALAGLRLDAVSGFASLVWAPTGIALAAVLLAGPRIWPGVFVGALVANLLTGAPPAVAGGIAVGNTLEALLAAYALRLLPGFRLALDRLRDVVALLLVAVLLSTMVSASVGVMSLWLGGLVVPHTVLETWRTWWVGDAIGALLVAPLILVWSTDPPIRLPARRVTESIALLLCLVIASLVVFLVPMNPAGSPLGEAYVFFPLLMWATIRFGQRGAVTASAIVSAVALAGTVMSLGPFTQSTTHENLFALQTFMGITAATFLVLGASVSEREHSREELKFAHDVVAAANQAKAEFLAVMSHELRTPLNAIAGYSELLSLGVPGELNEKQRDAVDRIRTNQQHLLALIDDVLSFARIEAGSNALTPTAVRLCDVLDSLEPLLRPDLEKRELNFIWSGCDTALMIEADPVKLRQLLLNVLGNAMKFTPPSGRIELSAVGSGDKALIRVADTGIGIPEDKLERIFEPFFQVHTGTTREYSGAGLGLAISRDFARAMGGDIGIASTVGKGSVVTIRFPLLETGAAGST